MKWSEGWKDAGKTLTDNSYLPQLVEAFSNQTAGELKNMTRTAGFKTMRGCESIGNAYRNELDKAVIKICSGTFSHEKVLHDTVHNLAQSGLRSIDFESGYSMQLDTAARLAVRTGCHQLAGKVMDKNIAQSGENLVYVDKHNGARNTGTGHANHEQWQGKVYYIKPGRDYKEEAERIGQKEITDLWETTGYSVEGTHENDPLGLYGYNCRHNSHPWFEGASTFPVDLPEPPPVTINGKTYDHYAMTQKMRSMERGIRALKREKEALEALGMDTTEIRAKIRRKTAEYKEFCGICNIRPKTERLRYECGTSDLKRTEAWRKFNDSSEVIENHSAVQYEELYDKTLSGKKFVSGNNLLFEGKTMEEKSALAIEMVKEVTDRKNKWSGVVSQNKDMWANGKYKSDGSMEFKENADNRTYLHEALHSASAPYISAEKRKENLVMEEASVELLAREILSEKNIPYSYIDRENVNALVRINSIMNIEDAGLKYAKLVYNIHPDKRFMWLSGKIKRFISKHQENKEELYKLLDMLR